MAKAPFDISTMKWYPAGYEDEDEFNEDSDSDLMFQGMSFSKKRKKGTKQKQQQQQPSSSKERQKKWHQWKRTAKTIVGERTQAIGSDEFPGKHNFLCLRHRLNDKMGTDEVMRLEKKEYSFPIVVGPQDFDISMEDCNPRIITTKDDFDQALIDLKKQTELFVDLEFSPKTLQGKKYFFFILFFTNLSFVPIFVHCLMLIFVIILLHYGGQLNNSL
jgi:hypothetical protein